MVWSQTVSEAFCVKIVGQRKKKIPCKYKAERNWLAFSILLRTAIYYIEEQEGIFLPFLII